MTYSMADTLRTRFNSLRVSFFKKRLHLSGNQKDLGGDSRGQGAKLVFSQNKGEKKSLFNDVNQKKKKCLIAFLFIPVFKTPLVPRGMMFNLCVPFMFTLNFARRHRHFIWHTHYF